MTRRLENTPRPPANKDLGCPIRAGFTFAIILIRAYEAGLLDKSSTLSREGFYHLSEAHSLPFCFFQQNLLDATGILDSFLRPIHHALRQVQSGGKFSKNIFSYHLSIGEIDSERYR